MKLTFDLQLADIYKSQSQKVRVLTEQWVGDSVFCPNCGHFNIDKYPNNQPVADFYCSNCKEDYELSRAGWIGCNILLQSIPQTGKIFFIKDKLVESKEEVLAEWQKTLFLREEKEIKAKGWLLDVMICVDKLGLKDFSLDDVYAFENKLSKKHPDNRHIKDKIRQQLQVLRDKGYLEFTSRGNYRLT